MNPLVSIVVPTYNVEQYIHQCLKSLLGQTYENIEVICIDDCSTDTTRQIIESVIKTDNRIQLYCTNVNSGPSVCRNIGISKSNGKYIMFCDGDDYILDNTVYDCFLLIKKYNTDAVYFNIEQFYPDNTHCVSFSDKRLNDPIQILSTDDDSVIFNFTNAVCGFFNLQIFRDNNLKFADGRLYEDWIFMTHVHMLSLKILWYNVPLYRYRREIKNSITSNITMKCIDMITAYMDADRIISDKMNTFQNENDIKIIDNGILFLKYKLFNSNYKTRANFYKRLGHIFSKFPKQYYFSIISLSHQLVQRDIFRLYILLYKKYYIIIEIMLFIKRIKTFIKGLRIHE